MLQPELVKKYLVYLITYILASCIKYNIDNSMAIINLLSLVFSSFNVLNTTFFINVTYSFRMMGNLPNQGKLLRMLLRKVTKS